MTPIQITHFSDVLCIWAYLSQIRVDELRANFGAQVKFEYHYFQVFGDVAGKMDRQWRNRGGITAYAAHVQEIAAGFPHITVHADAWLRNTPSSSMPSHLFLCAVRVLEGAQPHSAHEGRLLENAAWTLREAFFSELLDVSRYEALLQIAERLALPISEIESILASGHAHAALSADLELARDNQVRASPTMIFNSGRQQLTGNVGYRVLEANVRELIHSPSEQHSWC